MKRQKNKRTRLAAISSIVLLWLLLSCIPASAQLSAINVDLSLIDGLELSPDNMFNLRISNPSGQSKQVEIRGRVYYRRSSLSFTYKFRTTLQPGTNTFSSTQIPTPTWTFSDNGLKDLFLLYKKLPQGTYEYCVTVATFGSGSEAPEESDAACVYQTVEDLFLINLVTPENDAKIYEYNPMLAWIVNYPFASELTYKLRVAELKQGQNPQVAITRNNPMYKDDRVMTTGTVYPVAAKPLQKGQPYVWTVDAYYKGILLGGAEVWKFTIIDDTILKALPVESFYVDIRQENNNSSYYAAGIVKLKYVLEEKRQETVQLVLKTEDGKIIKMKNNSFPMVLGDNRLDLNFKEDLNLKHNGKYILEFTNSSGETFLLPFKYLNPDLL